MVTLRASELAASGYFVIARHPWLSGKLAEYAKALGKVYPKDAVLLRIPPPWSVMRDYLDGASEAQLRAMLEFGRVAQETAGQPLIRRLTTIKERLSGREYPGKREKPKITALQLIEQKLGATQQG